MKAIFLSKIVNESINYAKIHSEHSLKAIG